MKIMTGWRHWLTKYTNKENTFQDVATFHTTIPTYVAVNIDILPTSVSLYLCRDGCVKGSNVVECALLVCVLCQPVPPTGHPYFCRFLLECLYVSKFVMQCRPHAHLQLMHHSSTCTNKWDPTASTLYPLSFPCKVVQVVSCICSKQSSNEPFIPREFLTILAVISNATCIALWH